MGEITRGEQNLIDDLNEFIRQTSDQLDEQETSTGIRPHPVIESTEQTLDTSRFGLEFAPQPEATVEPLSGGGGGVLTGACCYDDGTCDDLEESDCTDAGGNWQGFGTTCDDDPPPCVGVCCEESGCVDDSTPDSCAADGGTWIDFGTTCEDDPPPCELTGACCVDSVCSIETSGECDGSGGYYLGDGTTCGIDTCNCPPPNPETDFYGACCEDGGGCDEGVPESTCLDIIGGTFHLGLPCTVSGNPCCPDFTFPSCDTPSGACCISEMFGGGCFANFGESDCTSVYLGTWLGAGTICGFLNCPCCDCL